MFDLIDLFMSKNNPKEIMREEKVKKEWSFIGSIFSEMIAVCCGKLKIDISSIKNIKYQDILPLPSSAYHLMKISQNAENQMPHVFLDW